MRHRLAARLRATLIVLLALPLGAAALAVLAPPSEAGTAATSDCRPLLPAAGPAEDVLDGVGTALWGLVAAANDMSVSRLADLADDSTLWLDRCGKALYVDDPTEETAGGETSAAGSSSAQGPLVSYDRTFELQSRPGSARTLYLDFTGATVAGTAWNDTVGQRSITVPAYTTDGDATSFSDQELSQVQRAWAIVAEDYAPFDVNVTTRDPGVAAIERSGPTDTRYGDRVVVTAGGPVWEAMGKPGGISYVGVFDLASSHGYYQPSWVFTSSLGAASGKEVGEAAAHEAGHSFGLSHDGTASSEYSTGSGVWAPIMGSGYYAPVTQWSRGEYTGASNTEDDTAIIAKIAPYVADDHAGTADEATPLVAGTPTTGLIGTRADTDAFALAASGTTTVTVTPSALQPDLDVALSVYDAAGQLVERVDPPATFRGAGVAAGGLDATATFTAPDAGARYTVVVDGVGTGDPRTAGKYSDYGSLGAYRIVFGTAGTPVGVVLPTGRHDQTGPVATTSGPVAHASTEPRGRVLVRGKVGRRYRAQARIGVPGKQLRWWRRGVLPSGVRLVVAHGRVVRLTGRPRRAGTFRFTLVGRDGHGPVVSRPFELVVRR